jgi:hypothetical protein
MPNLSKPLQILCGSAVHISGIHLPMISECSFTGTNILQNELTGLQLLLCPVTKFYMIIKTVPMQSLV